MYHIYCGKWIFCCACENVTVTENAFSICLTFCCPCSLYKKSRRRFKHLKDVCISSHHYSLLQKFTLTCLGGPSQVKQPTTRVWAPHGQYVSKYGARCGPHFMPVLGPNWAAHHRCPHFMLIPGPPWAVPTKGPTVAAKQQQSTQPVVKRGKVHLFDGVRQDKSQL